MYFLCHSCDCLSSNEIEVLVYYRILFETLLLSITFTSKWCLGRLKVCSTFGGYLYVIVPYFSWLICLSMLYVDGVNVAASHPLISGTLAFGVGIFALKSMFLDILLISLEFPSPRMLCYEFTSCICYELF